MDVPTYPFPYSPPTHHVQSSPIFHHHTHTLPNTKINPIEVSDNDCEEKCEERHNLDERGDSPHMWVEYSFGEGTQATQIWGERCAKIEEGGHDQHHESSIDIDCVLFS